MSEVDEPPPAAAVASDARPHPTGARIEVRGVSKTYGTRAGAVQALTPVSFQIGAGEFVSLIGPSGCGKSTLLLMVAGLLPPTTGSIAINGTTLDKPLTDVGIVFQDHLLLDFRTALDNVMLHADIRGLPRKAIETRARELFAQLRLEAAMEKYPRQLSGGMRQRVSLIRTLVHDPSLLLLDEPFGALDALTRLQVRTDLEALWMRRRPTVLFITHSVEEAVYLSDRILIFSARPGRLVAEVAVDLPKPRYASDVRSDPRFLEVRREVSRLLAEKTDYYGGAHADASTAPAVHGD
jgi:NitT/TauT family transport system ATP-binding protein